MKQLLALFAALVVFAVGAQTVQTTPNLIKSGTNHTWYGVTTGTVAADYMGGTSAPRYDPATNTIYFSYANGSPGQTMMINQALANAGAGVKINGYTYSYDVRNMNGDDRQPGVDTFTVSQLLRGPANSVLLSSNQFHNTKFEWKTVTGVKTAVTPYNIADTTYIQFGVSGVDSGFWGGYFGPQIRNVDMKLNYTVDPCVSNPAYSPSCAGYDKVLTSNNSTATSYAINQALNLSGSGVMINGLNYGYSAVVGGDWCSATFLGMFCSTWEQSKMIVDVNVTNSSNTNIYSNRHIHTDQNTNAGYSYSYILPKQLPLSTMGDFSMTSSQYGTGAIYNQWSNWRYTPDPCTVDPLSSASCPGYAQAYQDQQCSANPLYATMCPGYAAAYLTQQCNANPLYNASCPGYASAYLTQQCSSNPLYSIDCPGYQQAYFNQQCSNNSLYSNQCPGYEAAYHTQQCTANPLYMSDCPGYQSAYLTQQCNISQLYSSSCPNYQQAYFAQQCQLNGLYDRTCPNYGTTYAAKNILSTPTTTTTAAVTIVTSTESNATVASNPAAAAISDPVVSSVVSTPTTTSATSPTSVTSVISAPSATTSPAAAAATNPVPVAVTPAAAEAKATEAKKTDNAVASVEKKSGGNRENARAAATERAKELANEAGKATTLESQVATQSLVVGLMGYVPGFSAYQNSIVPDVMANAVARQYHKPTVDNRNAQRRLSGASEIRWQEMVDSQYNLGK